MFNSIWFALVEFHVSDDRHIGERRQKTVFYLLQKGTRLMRKDKRQTAATWEECVCEAGQAPRKSTEEPREERPSAQFRRNQTLCNGEELVSSTPLCRAPQTIHSPKVHL